MKLKDLKSWVNGLPDEELEMPLLYNSVDYGLSGEVVQIKKCIADLYYSDGEAVASLYTKEELVEQGLPEEDIKVLEVEIPKEAYYIEISMNDSAAEIYCAENSGESIG